MAQILGCVRAYWSGSERVIPDRDFLGPAPSYVFIRDPMRRLCYKMIACSISGRGQAPEKGRKSRARLSGGHFIRRLAAYFRLVSDQGLRGLSVVATSGPERQQVVAAGTPRAAEDAPAADEGAQADPAPVQAPQPPSPTPQH
ncbi:hypothetical protein Tco_1535242 [Tanacetum coccineum]